MTERGATEPSTIESIQVRTISLPLPEPLVLGAMTVERREYVGLKMTASDGTVGWAYCLSREAPMAEIVERLIAPHVIGEDPGDPEAVWRKAFRGSAIVGRVGLVRRALGLVDIACWDIAAKQRGAPVWKLLGETGETRKAILVAAYPTSSRSAEQTADEVLTAAGQGWRLLKISRTADVEKMAELLRILSAGLPEHAELIVDVGFGWSDSEAALAEIAKWNGPRLAWLEDPLVPEDIAGYRTLVNGAESRIGVGDEVTDPGVLSDLMTTAGVGMLRVDVVALGGITPTVACIEEARSREVPVSGHVYPEVTAHLGITVETFDRSESGNRYDPAPQLIRNGPRFVDGHARPPAEPGLGFELAESVFGFERGR